LAHHPGAAPFPAGIVYHIIGPLPAEDVLQLLYDAFYESDAPAKPTDGEIRNALQSQRAVFLLDDVELSREEIERLIDAAPSSAFLLATGERRLWREARAVAVGGLPGPEALALIERELGRPLGAQERPAAQALCNALDGHPVDLLRAAAMAAAASRPLTEVALRVQSSPSFAAVMTEEIEARPEPERRLLAALAAMGGGPAHVEHLAALLDPHDPAPALDALLRRHLVHAQQSRYHLDETLTHALQREWDLTPWIQRSLGHLAAWAERHRADPDRIVDEAPVILRVLDAGVRGGEWGAVLRLARAVEGGFALGRRWGAWRLVLDGALQAARALGDRAAEAWARHQSGTRALCLGDATTAREHLTEALRIREGLRDRDAADVTRQNLGLLDGGVLPAEDTAPPPEAEPRADGRLRTLKRAGAALALAALASLLLWRPWEASKGGGLSAPAGLSATPKSDTVVELFWTDTSPSETGFEIQRSTDGGTTFARIGEAAANASRYEDSQGLSQNTTYMYRVRALGDGAATDYSQTAQVLTLPAAPTDLTVEPGDGKQLDLRWSASEPRPRAFKIERREIGRTVFQRIAELPGAELSSTDTNVAEGRTYEYRVRAVNSSGDSAPSNRARRQIPMTPPAVPTGVALTVTSGTQIDLAWTDASKNETGFTIERRADGEEFAKVGDVRANVTRFRDTGLTPGTTYTYRVKATNAGGDSPWSEEVSGATPANPPAAPRDLEAKATSATEVQLTWADMSDNETGFIIERSHADGSIVTLQAEAGSNSYTDTQLSPGTTYTYRIKAAGDGGESEYSNAVEATTQNRNF
jgi:fibronectin type 3 domain-containing protein